MFRVTQHVIQNRALLLRRKPVDLQVLSISRTRNPLLHKYKKAYEQERDPCPPPPPPEAPPPRDDRLLWGTVAALVVMGSFAVYAKQSPEIRDWLTIHAPWFDDIIAIMYQENQTYMEFICNSSADIKKYVTDFMKPNPCDDDGAEELVVKKISCDESGKEEEEEDIEAIEEEEVEEEEAGPCDSLPPPIAAKDICEYEACLREVGDTTVDNYMVARDASQCYSRIVAGVMRKFSFVEMKKLEGDLAEKNELVEQSIAKATQAEKQFKNLQRSFVCAMDVPKEKCENTKQLFKEYQDRITIMKNEYMWENEMAQTYDELRKKVDSVVSKYAFQNEAVYSGLDYNTPRPMLKTGEPDFLLVNTTRYIKKLRAAAQDEMDIMSARINRAYNHLPQGEKITAERDKALQALFSKRKHDNEKIFNTRLEDLKSDYAKETQANLDKLAKKHAELVVAKLKRKEEEANEKMDEIVAEKVAVEKQKFDTQLREMELKLTVIQAKLNERLKGEQESNRSKALYNAGAALLAATKKGEPTIKVDKELQAIDNASGDNDKLVATVLHSIPQSVWEKGIVPESVLRRNYHSMEKVALEVALVEQEGAPLPLYWLSWLQSTLLFMKLSNIPQAEIDNPPKANEIKGLDTFDLLQRARFWVERGNLSAALRYVSALEGASRAAAATWHRDAQAHCEVKQAAEAVLAHAAALGLRWL